MQVYIDIGMIVSIYFRESDPTMNAINLSYVYQLKSKFFTQVRVKTAENRKNMKSKLCN